MSAIKQVKNGFKDYYYLTETGEIFNASSNKMMIPDRNRYKLLTQNNQLMSISRKRLYNIVYNRVLCNDNIVNLQGEKWQEIKGSNGMYYVSNKGRIKSYQGYEARLLKAEILNGYQRVTITLNGQKTKQFIHTLVAMTFLQDEYGIAKQIHHKDGNRANNNVENLQWVTPKEHRQIHLRQKEQEQ